MSLAYAIQVLLRYDRRYGPFTVEEGMEIVRRLMGHRS